MDSDISKNLHIETQCKTCISKVICVVAKFQQDTGPNSNVNMKLCWLSTNPIWQQYHFNLKKNFGVWSPRQFNVKTTSNKQWISDLS